MAITSLQQQQPQIHRFPQSKYVDSVRWLPSPSPFQKSILIASFDSDTHIPSLQTHSLTTTSTQLLDTSEPLSQWTPPSRISSLKCFSSSSRPLIAASTVSGSLHILSGASEDQVLKPEISVAGHDFHVGHIGGVDLAGDFCVSVGEDGRVNLVSIGGGGGGLEKRFNRVFDANGLVSYSAVRWASPTEFVTGGYGLGLQWWDLRSPNAAVAQFKGNWDQGTTSGIIHSIDIHTSRKHTCLAGGSSGIVFAWDLRWQQQSILLSGFGSSDTIARPLSESEVWEVQYDYYTKPSNSNTSSSQILPAMICSEDGILAVIEQGEEPTELLAEPCAINSFDIDRQNPSDIICSLEWESVVILSRSQVSLHQHV